MTVGPRQGLLQDKRNPQVKSVQDPTTGGGQGEVAITFPENTKRVILEMCTSQNSALGADGYQARGACTVRITLDQDLTTDAGLAFCMSVASAARAANHPLTLFMSLPCTAGRPYWRATIRRFPGSADKLRKHKIVLGKLLNHAEILHKFAVGLYGDQHVLALFEWPDGRALRGSPLARP